MARLTTFEVDDSRLSGASRGGREGRCHSAPQKGRARLRNSWRLSLPFGSSQAPPSRLASSDRPLPAPASPGATREAPISALGRPTKLGETFNRRERRPAAAHQLARSVPQWEAAVQPSRACPTNAGQTGRVGGFAAIKRRNECNGTGGSRLGRRRRNRPASQAPARNRSRTGCTGGAGLPEVARFLVR